MKDYFQVSQNKYNPLLSESKPVVVRVCIDTKNPGLNFDDIIKGGFSDSLSSFVKKFSREHKCVGIINFNEINFIFNNTDELKRRFKKLETQNIASVFSQEIFHKLNNQSYIADDIIYTKVNVFNIFDNKVKSYIAHRQSQGFNNYLRYCTLRYLKFKDSYRKSSYELLEILQSKKQFSPYKINYVKNGMMYKEGFLVDISNVDKDIKEFNKSNAINIDNSLNIVNEISFDDI